MDIVHLDLPKSVVQQAQKITGERSASAALTALVRKPAYKADFKRGLQQSLREERGGRGKTFNNARAAVAYLKSL
ncbi:MAG: hypothetical protein AABY95_11325 [Pseudomonadota bacterium]